MIILPTNRMFSMDASAHHPPRPAKAPPLLGTRTIARSPAIDRPPRIGLKVGRKVLFIDPREIIAVHAEGSYVSLRRESTSYCVREPISQVAAKLHGYGFIRIHRSLLVNTSFVEEVRPRSTGEYFIRVTGGKEYTVTRTYKKNLVSPVL
jgi:two-component system LytT family response regulator